MEDWTGMGNAGGADVDSHIDGEDEVIAAVSKLGSRQWWWRRRQWRQWRQSASSLPDVGGGGRSGGRTHHG